MRVRTRVCAALGTAVTCCSIGVFAPAAGAATAQVYEIASNTALPLDAGRMVADVPAGHIFVFGDSTDPDIYVFDLGGRQVGEIPGQQDAAAAALSTDGSTLYVAEADSDSIVAIDAATLQQTASYATPGVSATSLAYAGGEIWFSTGSSIR